MHVKNILPYHDYSQEQLMALKTPHLLCVLGSARGRAICSCGKGHHCGDDFLDPEQLLFNQKQEELLGKVKAILSTRENVVSRKPTPIVEKKDKKRHTR